MLQGATVLVTGGAGFIGSHLVERLVREGCRVRATLHTHPAVVADPRIEYMRADLTKMEDCRLAVAGVDFVFHCAAATAGAAVIAETPLLHVTPNVVMTAQLMQAAHEARVRKFLYVSSSVAYPPTGDRPVREDEIFEGNPGDIYYAAGWMKRTAEWLCILYAQKLTAPMPTVVVRPSNIYGPRDKFDPRTSHVTAALIRRVVERQAPFVVWGTGNDVRDLLFIDDFIDGLLLAWQKSEHYLAVNLAAGEGHTVRELVQLACDVDGFADANVQFDPARPQMMPVRLIDKTRAREDLGFRPQRSLRDGLILTLEWYRKNRGNWSR